MAIMLASSFGILPGHKHSNTTGDGGTLDQTSQFDNSSLTATLMITGSAST